MRVSTRLLQACRITLFTRENCGLCTQARSVLSDVWDKRPFAFKEIDIIKPESKNWRDLYEFDVPVVSAHSDIQRCFFLLEVTALDRLLESVIRYTSAEPSIPRRTRSCVARPSSSCIGSPLSRSTQRWMRSRKLKTVLISVAGLKRWFPFI